MSSKLTLPQLITSDVILAELSQSRESRAELRRQFDAGQLASIMFPAKVYRTGKNRNFLRFRDEDMPDLASSFATQPFLRNHDTRDIGARDGTIRVSHLDGDSIIQEIEITTQRGVLSYLEGQIDRFSIGWYYDGITCSLCGQDWLSHDCSHWPGHQYRDGKGQPIGVCELIFERPQGKETSAVNAPAVAGTGILAQLSDYKEQLHMSKSQIFLPGGGVHQVEARPEGTQPIAILDGAGGEDREEKTRAWATLIRNQAISATILASGLPKLAQDAVRAAVTEHTDADGLSTLIEVQRAVQAAYTEASIISGVNPVINARTMQADTDKVQSGLDWMLGIPNAPTPAGNMRNIRELYLALTGDYNFRGEFMPDQAQLASATSTTLAGMAANSLNKAVEMHYANLENWRWFENIVSVQPHDGTTQPIQMIFVDGVANLPTVDEGEAYGEATVGDSKESMSFLKKGRYVGITLEMIRKSQIARIQAIPLVLASASVRTRSAAIAAIFTTASGTGPTLADDSTVLFHSNHANVSTVAFSAAEWAVQRKKIYSQTVPGTSKKLGMWPKFALLPIDLYDAALEIFGYGAGDVGKPTAAGTAQIPNPYAQNRPGDPRPMPLIVPDWTDANDWASIVDPRLQPVIQMAYANQPNGGGHPTPEIFSVTGETNGLIFTNDTLPVKIRDWWSYGVATYVGIAKSNV